jgi:hypothetical protein
MVNKQNYYKYILFSMLFLQSGCGGVRPIVPAAIAPTMSVLPKTTVVTAPAQFSYNTQPLFSDEARLFDIPLPVGSKVYDLSAHNEHNKRILHFNSALSQYDIFAYYRTEMECFGWQESAIFEGTESCLIFQKPTKTCVVTIRPESNKLNAVSLFIGPRKIID